MSLVTPDKIFEISNDHEFNVVALEIFEFQYQNTPVYRLFCDTIKKTPGNVEHYSQIPFLPIEFFKSHSVIAGNEKEAEITFTSSTTTSSIPSKHFVKDIEIYEKSFMKCFELFYGNCRDYVILALLPGYLERQGSSLVYMFDKLIKQSGKELSGFFLNDISKLNNTIQILKKENQKTILIGVTYALLDLAETSPGLNENFIVMETGGMKGKRKEMVKEELHNILKNGLHVNCIHSEYGMTELLSQAYSKGQGIFECPPWMKVMIRDTEDPFSYVNDNKTGGINVIDLANVNSCSFIATGDLGRKNGESFEVMGRFDNSDIRGCNLMVE